MPNPKPPLKPGRTYHVFNHAVGSDNLFRTDDNYIYFLERISKWILPVADIFSYCLMPNHFHMTLRIKHAEILRELFAEQIDKNIILPNPGEKEFLKAQSLILIELINRQFSHCFNSYAQAFNKMNKRKGSLFRQSFQRKQLYTNENIIRNILYVHRNPHKHGFNTKWENWKFSSYREILGNKPTIVAKETVLHLFGGLENFNDTHRSFL
ncbi:hypothetical protein BH11BAC1_BH11BAC1_08960 [soil metagenome]